MKKKQPRTPRINQKGIGLIVVLLIVMALALLASAIILFSTTEIFVARNDANAKEALFAAEAGLHHAERVLRTFNSITQIQTMYASYATTTPTFRGIKIGHRFMNGTSWVMNSSLDGVRGYEVYVENDELNDSGNPLTTENNNVFLIRSLGIGGLGTRKILEVCYNASGMQGLSYNSQVGGGSSNLTAQ